MRIGGEDVEEVLIGALWKYGDKEMAITYLNCEIPSLEEAAREWADEHGYDVVPWFMGDGDD